MAYQETKDQIYLIARGNKHKLPTDRPGSEDGYLTIPVIPQRSMLIQ